MGQFKCFVKGNYFYLIDLETTIEYEGLRKDVFIRRHTDSSDKFFFSGVNQAPLDYEGGIHIDDILDENGTPYGSVEDFMNWYQSNTGNFNGGGNTPTSILKYIFSLKTSTTGASNDELDALVFNANDSDFLGYIQWSKVADGIYHGFLENAFTEDKTFSPQFPFFFEGKRSFIPVYEQNNTFIGYITMYRKDNSIIEILCFDDRMNLIPFRELITESIYLSIYVG